jgi:hypothetical protein
VFTETIEDRDFAVVVSEAMAEFSVATELVTDACVSQMPPSE